MEKRLTELLAGFEAERVRPADTASVMEVACALERLITSLRLLVTKRAAESRVWADEGHRNAAGWVAQISGSSYGEAVSQLETAEQLEALPDTTEALRAGRLSRSQVREVAQAAYEHPEAEKELLRVAAEGTVKKLKDAATYVRAKAASKESEVARYRAIHRRRYMRTWTDPEGAFRLDLRVNADSGARLLSRVQAEADLIFKEARGAGEYEPPCAYAADALLGLVTGERSHCNSRKDSSGRSKSAVAVVRVDLAALNRGHAKVGEVCEIPGVGPVPVSLARRVVGDCFLKLLVKDGVDIRTVCHAGRTIPAHVMTALEERDPVCVVPECDVAHGLEVHHWKEDFATCKTTSLDGVARVCGRHHDRITYEGFQLVGGPGKWKLIRAPGARGQPVRPSWA